MCMLTPITRQKKMELESCHVEKSEAVASFRATLYEAGYVMIVCLYLIYRCML